MAPCTPITPKNHRKRLSNDDKLKIIEESKKPGFCRKKTMDKYGIGRSVICNILKNQKEILTKVQLFFWIKYIVTIVIIPKFLIVFNETCRN